MSQSGKNSGNKKRPLRKLIKIGALVGIGVAVKKALADKGGSYEASVTPLRPATTATPTAPSSPASDESEQGGGEPLEQPEPQGQTTSVTPKPAPSPGSSSPVTAEQIVERDEDERAQKDDSARPEPPANDPTANEGFGRIDPFGIR